MTIHVKCEQHNTFNWLMEIIRNIVVHFEILLYICGVLLCVIVTYFPIQIESEINNHLYLYIW